MTLDFTGHERHTTAATETRDRLGWQGRLWQSWCECGFVGEPERHPIDAAQHVHEHAVAHAKLRAFASAR